MSKRDASVLIDDVITALDKIQRYTFGLTQSAFLADEKTVDAVIRNLEIIGEAIRQLPTEFRERHSSIPWAQIVGMRNRIVHDYAGVDLEIVWYVITESLPVLQKQLQAEGLIGD